MIQNRRAVWDAGDCALLLIDYQDSVLAEVFEQDRRLIEFNASYLARLAVRFHIPVALSTIGVDMGVREPTIPGRTAELPDVEPIDRHTQNTWEAPAFVQAVKATGRTRLVIGGIVTSVCLAQVAVSALADGYEVMFIEDAVGDSLKENHDIAVLRLAHAGAIPNTTMAMMGEWCCDWKSPLAAPALELFVPYREGWAALVRAPERLEVAGLGGEQCARAGAQRERPARAGRTLQ
jgi:nicotinamidase-related amidase